MDINFTVVIRPYQTSLFDSAAIKRLGYWHGSKIVTQIEFGRRSKKGLICIIFSCTKVEEMKSSEDFTPAVINQTFGN